MRTAEYERVVLQELHWILIEPGSQAANLARRGETHGGVRVDRVYFDESGPEHEIAILFRDLNRPDSPSGYMIRADETPDALHESTKPYTDLSSAAQVWAEIVWVPPKRSSLPSAAGYPAPAPPRSATKTPRHARPRRRNRNVTWPSPY